MWIDTSIMVGDQPVGLAVQRLESSERDRAAASLAWFSHLAITGDSSTESAEWQTFMQSVIFEHVRFAVQGNTDELTASWWDEACRQAIVAFVEANELSPALKRHLRAIERPGAADGSGVVRAR
jgi:hypothetical protein